MNQNDANESLLNAIAGRDVDAMRVALDAGADVNAVGEVGFGETALIAAVYYGHRDGVSLLLERGADVYAKDQDGNTAGDLANHEIAALLRAAIEARDLNAVLPPAPSASSERPFEDLGKPDPQPVRPNRPRL